MGSKDRKAPIHQGRPTEGYWFYVIVIQMNNKKPSNPKKNQQGQGQGQEQGQEQIRFFSFLIVCFWRVSSNSCRFSQEQAKTPIMLTKRCFQKP